jgi:hypothetical protein
MSVATVAREALVGGNIVEILWYFVYSVMAYDVNIGNSCLHASELSFCRTNTWANRASGSHSIRQIWTVPPSCQPEYISQTTHRHFNLIKNRNPIDLVQSIASLPFVCGASLKVHKIKLKNLGYCISPSGRLRALRAECVTRVTRQTGTLNERSRTTTSRSQQKIRTDS